MSAVREDGGGRPVSGAVLLACALVFAGRAVAADCLAILPVTDKILAVQIRDGHTDFCDNRTQEVRDTIQHTTGLLDEKLADEKGGFVVVSGDDEAFSDPQRPVASGRRSRPYQVHSKMKWDQGPKSPYHAMRDHWIYLELPQPMQEGKTYTVKLPPGLVSNGNEWTLTFDPASVESPAIAVGQAGFTPEAPKFAIIGHWMGSFDTPVHAAGGLELGPVGADSATATGADFTGGPFFVVDDASGGIVFRGTLAFRRDKTFHEASEGLSKTKNFSNCDTWQADFSEFKTPGRYRVVVPRMGSSVTFEIKPGAYRDLFRTAMQGIFHQRSGIVREVLPGVNVPRAHHSANPDVKFFYDPKARWWLARSHKFQDEKNFDFQTNPLDPAKGDFYGWYYDAGDWDCYQHTHHKVPLSLLLTYVMNPAAFRDGDVGNRYKLSDDGPWIEEGRNGVPDILDEARWLPDRNREWRDILIAHGWGTGGFPGYVGRDAGVGGPPWTDKRAQAIAAEDPEATYAVAASLALLAHALDLSHKQSKSDGEHPEKAALTKEAVAAYDWATKFIEAHPADDTKDVQAARMAAAACLYVVTGRPAYNEDFLSRWNDKGVFTSHGHSYWSAPGVPQLGELAYLLAPESHPGLSQETRAEIIRNKTRLADFELVEPVKTNGYRFPVGKNRWIAQSTFSTPSPLSAVAAWMKQDDARYRDVLHAQAAYHIGGNEMGVSHMTGIGQRREHAVFLPVEWGFFNSDSMAYPYRNFPGYVAYNRGAFDVGGIGNESQNYELFYPPLDKRFPEGPWPVTQKRSNSRYSIAGSEFTVHENQAANAMVYGSLLDPSDPPAPPRQPPTVSLGIKEGTELPADAPTSLTASGSELLDRVEYFYNWQFIGRSKDKANSFAVAFDPTRFGAKPGSSARLIVIGYDKHGEMSLETAEVERGVTFAGSRDEG